MACIKISFIDCIDFYYHRQNKNTISFAAKLRLFLWSKGFLGSIANWFELKYAQLTSPENYLFFPQKQECWTALASELFSNGLEVLFLPLSASNVCRFRHFYRIHRQVFSITRIQPIQIWIIRTLMKTLKTLFTITLPATNFANHQLEFE